jgi:hypothetical protein
VHGGIKRLENPLGKVAGRGWHFGHTDLSAGIIDQGHVREGPTDIDADTPTHPRCALSSVPNAPLAAGSRHAPARRVRQEHDRIKAALDRRELV